MDLFDRQHYAAVYRTLAEVLERDRPADRPENHLSYALGNLSGRIFVGTDFLPPDELLEEVARLLRSGRPEDLTDLAARLRKHAQHLDEHAD